MSGLMERLLKFLRVEPSITKRLRLSFVTILILLMLPAIISLITMAGYSSRYHVVIARMGRISSLKPVVLDSIPDELFSIVAGRRTFDESSVWNDIVFINGELDELSAGISANTEMIVARRTMNTLSSYVSEMQRLWEAQAPVAENEALLEEVRAVAALVGDMLDACMDKEMAAAGQTSEDMQTMARNVVLAEALLLLLCITFSIIAQRSLTSSIREPIARLESLAGNIASGDLRARVPQAETAELKSLTTSLNLMGDKLQALIDENKREQENLKKSELRTLQAQIAPHFLYNTLDAIVWLAEEKRSDEVIRITKALSDFFRISLSQGQDWITVKRERVHIEGYLTIQQIRYRDILEYEIDIPEELDDITILKLVLQPLVENAIYHGVKHRRGRGRIVIRGRQEGGMLSFSVSDDGAGMDTERLEEVRRVLRSDSATDGSAVGYGLYNVDKRIRLYYNQPEGLSVMSGSGGTCVSFRVPARRREDV